jgi:uncharacterized repeat protein (TIGR03847 family)
MSDSRGTPDDGSGHDGPDFNGPAESLPVEPSHVFENPERFVVGTVGQPGDRAFYLQATAAGAVVTVALEKAEVSALAQGMVTLLETIGHAQPPARRSTVDAAPLDTPFAEDFRVSELSVAWDGERVVVEAGDGEASRLRVALSVAATLAFVNRAETVVAAGRPDCVLCGRPAGDDGHFCPRLN